MVWRVVSGQAEFGLKAFQSFGAAQIICRNRYRTDTAKLSGVKLHLNGHNGHVLDKSVVFVRWSLTLTCACDLL